MLLAIDGYVRKLRVMRIELGDPESEVPEYRVHLIPGPEQEDVTRQVLATNAVLYALAYTEVSPPQHLPAPPGPPSDELPTMHISLLPDGSRART
jgi:hypothetical protein